MLKGIGIKFKLDILIAVVATFTSILFITLSYLWPDYSIQILSILIILLPNIYVVGNLIIRGVLENEMRRLRDGFDRASFEVGMGIEQLESENESLKDILKKNEIKYVEDDF